MSDAEEQHAFLSALDSDDLDERVNAIQALGDIGDETALRVLRQRLAAVNRELVALVTAVGKLKRRLGVK